jgi:hypothetical protein
MLAETSRFGGWAEESRQKSYFGERWVRPGIAVGSKGDTILSVCADDGGLAAMILVLGISFRR